MLVLTRQSGPWHPTAFQPCSTFAASHRPVPNDSSTFEHLWIEAKALKELESSQKAYYQEARLEEWDKTLVISCHIYKVTSLGEAYLEESDQHLAQPFCGCLVSHGFCVQVQELRNAGEDSEDPCSLSGALSSLSVSTGFNYPCYPLLMQSYAIWCTYYNRVQPKVGIHSTFQQLKKIHTVSVLKFCSSLGSAWQEPFRIQPVRVASSSSRASLGAIDTIPSNWWSLFS